MQWVVVMEKVGGFLGYQALLEDARAYEDVVIFLEAEAEAEKIRKLTDHFHA